MFNKLMFSAAIIFSAVSINPVLAKGPAKLITEVEGISEYRLDNGLRVLLFPDQSKETITVNVTYHVGSKHENYGETGMAHLLEHMVFKGTPGHPDIPAELSSHGARPNGTTWTDRTNYYETFSATEENISWALDMEADRMVNSFIAKEDLDSEMTVVRNEFERGENSPFRVTLQRMTAAAFDWHNYGKSTIGAKADLENVPIDRLQAFYQKYYQPDNATLIVAGKFEQTQMLEKVQKYFGSIPKPERVIAPLYTAEPAQDGEKSVAVRRVGDIQMIGAMYHIPAGSHPEYAAVEVLNKILGDTPSGRLHKQLVEGELASRVYGFNFQWQEPGVAIFFAEVDKEKGLNTTADKMLAVLEGLAAEPVTEEEVTRAKRSILKDIALSFNSSERIALDLSEWLGMGDWRLYFLNRDRIENVSKENVQAVASKYFQRNNRTAGRFIPTEQPGRVEIPLVASVSDMVEGYTGRGKIAEGENFAPSFDNIDARTTMVKLDNGAGLSLLSKKTRGESVGVSIRMRGGSEKTLHGKSMAASASVDMLLRGSGKLDRQALQDEFDKLKASVKVDVDPEGVVMRILTTKSNLSPVLDLASQVFKDPSFDNNEFEQYKSTQKVDLEESMQDPQALAFEELSRLQNPVKKGHPRYVATFAERLAELAELSLKDVEHFHQQFYGAQAMQIAVVGDFDQASIQTQLETLFGTWKAKTAYEPLAQPYQKIRSVEQEFNTPDKEYAVFISAIMLPIGENSEDAAALELVNYIFGGGFLNSRLAARLRQKDGLSYGAGSFLRMSDTDERTGMAAYAISAPQNLDKVEKGFKEELALMLKDGVSDEEVQSAKSGLLQGKKVSRAQDGELVRTLRNNVYLDRTMQWHKAYEERLKNLSAAELNKVMNKYLSVEGFAIIKAGDMSKVEQ